MPATRFTVLGFGVALVLSVLVLIWAQEHYHLGDRGEISRWVFDHVMILSA